MPAGGPRKHTVEEIAAVLTETGGLIALTARKLGYSYNGLQNRIKASPTLQEIVISAREESVDTSELVIRRTQLNSTDPETALKAAFFIAKTLGKNRGYTERQEVTGADGGAITIRIVDDTDTAA